MVNKEKSCAVFTANVPEDKKRDIMACLGVKMVSNTNLKR